MSNGKRGNRRFFNEMNFSKRDILRALCLRAKARLERNVSNVRIRYLPDARHAITGQTAPILEFLRAAQAG